MVVNGNKSTFKTLKNGKIKQKEIENLLSK